MIKKKKCILVVEDNPNNLYLTTFILEKNEYQVITAENCAQAVQAAIENKPDLILMDMQLPGKSGYEAVRKIKNLEECCKIPIIALTAYALKGDREKTLQAGCDHYIEKPIDPDTFVQEIEKFLEEYNANIGC